MGQIVNYRCGGTVRLDAKVRCPGCKTTDVIADSDSTQWE
jgi:hypothetical protein